jgi:hypothetical protein
MPSSPGLSPFSKQNSIYSSSGGNLGVWSACQDTSLFSDALFAILKNCVRYDIRIKTSDVIFR